RLLDDVDTEDAAPDIVAQELVVIARHVDHARAVVDLAQHFAHDAALRLAPVPALDLPAVDDVADEIERVAFVVLEEIGEQLGLATARAQMGVGDEDGAVGPQRAPARRRWGCGAAGPRAAGAWVGGV